MWKSKKFIIGALLATVVLVGGIGGAVLAQTGDEDVSHPAAQGEALLERVSEIYLENTGVAIDTQQLKDAFTQASSEMRIEAFQSHLQDLVDQGEITQEQADQYLEWWESKPDFPIRSGFRGRGGLQGRGQSNSPASPDGLRAPQGPFPPQNI